MLTRVLLGLIRIYQRTLSPLFGDCCRFEPSCSRYATLALRYHGPWRGAWLTLKRLARCNPLFSGGVDLPPMPPDADPQDREIDWSRFARRIDACCSAHQHSSLDGKPSPSPATQQEIHHS